MATLIIPAKLLTILRYHSNGQTQLKHNWKKWGLMVQGLQQKALVIPNLLTAMIHQKEKRITEG